MAREKKRKEETGVVASLGGNQKEPRCREMVETETSLGGFQSNDATRVKKPVRNVMCGPMDGGQQVSRP